MLTKLNQVQVFKTFCIAEKNRGGNSGLFSVIEHIRLSEGRRDPKVQFNQRI